MKFKVKVVSVATMALFFVAACGSSSSDAKKAETTKVEPVAQTNDAQASSEPAKVVKADSETKKPMSEKAVDKKPLKVDASEFIAGKHYVEIFPPMQTDASAGKVEVVELMWLGCPHCYTLEPIMLKYKKNHPDFVEFKQVPAMLNPSWAADATTYYIAEILDPTGEKEVVTQIFQAIHEQKRRLRGPDAVKRFFTQLGFTAEQVDSAQNSMAFQAKIKRAQEISASSQAQSVPTVIINGKYRTSPYIAGSEENLMKIIDMLTKKEKQ